MPYVIKWYWDFGDGEYSTEQNPYHVYKTPGLYTISLTVTDSKNNTATYTRTEYVTVSTNESFVHGIAYQDNRKCFNYGLRPEHGGGWSENRGANWVWPESQASILRVTKGDYVYKIVWDERNGLPFTINLRPNTLANPSLDTIYYDKKNLPQLTTGYEIGGILKTREFVGENRYYKLKHEETYFDIRPEDVDAGYRSNQQFDVTLYTDGEAAAKDTLTDISDDREQVFLRKKEGDTVQLQIDSATSDFRISKIEPIIRAKDVARHATDNSITEDDYEVEFANPELWFTRGYDDGVGKSGYLYNRVARADIGAGGVAYTYGGEPTMVVGPDGLTYSGVTITTKLELGNDAISSGTLILWHSSGYSISGVSLTQISDAVSKGGLTWYCSYYQGDIPANLELDVDGVPTLLYDLRLYDSTLSSASMTHYYNDVVNNEGKGYLPGF